MKKFENLGIIVLATTEQITLKETIKALLNNCSENDISEILILLASADCPSACSANEIVKNNTSTIPISCHIQKNPGLYFAVFEAPHLISKCSHFLIIGSDLEMDPHSVPEMIEMSKKNPNMIVCASKFMKCSQREDYGKIHYLCNRTVNYIIGKILHVKATEIISTFQIYPVDIFQEMNFTDEEKAYYEYTLRPLAMGKDYIEISTNYSKRYEGKSTFTPKKYILGSLTFFRIAYSERKRAKKIIKQ